MAAPLPIDATLRDGVSVDNVGIRRALLHRKELLETAVRGDRHGELRRLLFEVDDALHRMEEGRFGSCELCHEAIERECLEADPLRRVCLECLSSSERRSLEADLELAIEVQGSLIPSGEIAVPGWQAFVHSHPAGAVGGDFVDLVETADRTATHLVVGDVAGKGVAAALLASHLQALFRSSVSAPLSLPERVARINRLFSAVSPARIFATLVWVVVDREGGGELVNAGHLPAVVVGRHGCRMLESTGVPVGLFPAARYAATRFELAPGEQLLLFTDGVTESADGRDREYGVDALWTLVSERDLELSPEDAVRRYLNDVTRHRGGREQQDDLTVMVLRRSCCASVAEPAGQRVISSSL